VKTGEVNEAMEGTLVRISGRVVKTSGATFYVDDGSGQIKVFIKSATGIDKPRMRQGNTVTITGVVSQTTTGYRILPRYQEDVLIGTVAGFTSFPRTGVQSQWLPPELWYGVGGLAALQLLIAYRSGEPLLGRRKAKST